MLRREVFENEAFRVHCYSSGPSTFYANAFIVELRNSVVCVDALMSVSDARELRQRVVELEKPFRALILTHGHPDHFGGSAELTTGFEIAPELISSRNVRDSIKYIDDLIDIPFKEQYGDEWPNKREIPSRLMSDGEVIYFDGVPFRLYELGPGESHWDEYWVMGDNSETAFVGDIVVGGVHAYMGDGHTEGWLKNLNELEVSLNKTEMLFVGHGVSGDPVNLIRRQREYINLYRDSIKRIIEKGRTISDSDQDFLISKMKELVPSNTLEQFIASGARAVADELMSLSNAL